MKVTIKKGYHEGGAIAALVVDNNIILLVEHTGHYPVAVAEDGRSTDVSPYIGVSINGGTRNGVPFYNGVTVTANGTWHNGRRRRLIAFSSVHYDGKHDTAAPDYWIELGRSKVSEAIAVLLGIDEIFDTAQKIIEAAWTYQQPMSRSEYDAACAACAVEVLTDAECTSYGVRYGSFSFPEYPPAHVASMHLATRRMAALDRERAAQAQPQPPAQRVIPAHEGQLWEPCGRCGREPVYMPLHLCDQCWPSQPA